MKLTIVIPTYTITDSLHNMAMTNILAWRRYCDNIIVCEDGGECSDLIAPLAKLYLYHENIGVCNNAKMGWEIALQQGADYVLLTDSDVTLLDGDLSWMCIPGRVTVPTLKKHPNTQFTAPTLCVPRTVSDKFGIYDDAGGSHRNEGFDAVYNEKVRDLVTRSGAVLVDHIGGATRRA